MRFMQTAAAAAIASAFSWPLRRLPDCHAVRHVLPIFPIRIEDWAPGKSTDTVQMDSGNYLGSRFGLKGEEKITDTTSVGFILENGFSSDTGSGARPTTGSSAARRGVPLRRTRISVPSGWPSYAAHRFHRVFQHHGREVLRAQHRLGHRLWPQRRVWRASLRAL